jgi:hypothetical protein
MDKSIRIVVADRGWVFVGEVIEADSRLIINNAQNIRFWGTSKGLGELALSGPTRHTKLDPCGTVIIPQRAVILQIPCQTTNWS